MILSRITFLHKCLEKYFELNYHSIDCVDKYYDKTC